MKIQICRLVLLFLVLSTGCAWSQTDASGQSTDTQQPTTQGPNPAYSLPDSQQSTTPGPKPAFTYPDSASPLSFLSDNAENSSISLGIGGGIVYDSNVSQFSPGPSESGILYQVRPSIKIQQIRPTLNWMFGYQGGIQSRAYFGDNPNFNNVQNNFWSHNALADILWQFAPHWQVHANDIYVYSADPFDAYLTRSGVPTLNNPNPTIYSPLSVFSENIALLALTNQMTAHDTLTFTGTENFRRASNTGGFTSPFQNLVSYGGRVDYSHQLSARLGLGGGYDFESLDFGHGLQRSGIQDIKFSVDYLIKPHMSISAWIGPEYTAVKNVVHIFIFTEVIHQSEWNVAGGANFGWQGVHNSLRVSFSHQISDGSVYLGTTSVYQGMINYARVLTSRLNFEGGLQYFNNNSISLARRTFEETIGTASLTRRISPSLSASLRYAFLHETQQHIFVGKPTYIDNQIGFNVQYTWTHPLGQ